MKSGAAASVTPKCKYYDQLMFMFDKTSNKSTTSNTNIEIAESSNGADQMNNQETVPGEKMSTLKRKEATAEAENQVKPIKSAKGKSDISLAMVDSMLVKALGDLDKKEKNSVDPEEIDGDVSFCQSLVPILKSLTQRKNRQAKLKIQQVLYDLEFED